MYTHPRGKNRKRRSDRVRRDVPHSLGGLDGRRELGSPLASDEASPSVFHEDYETQISLRLSPP